MTNTDKQFWTWSIGEVILWVLPAPIAAWGHVYASSKAGLPPAAYIMWNERTARANFVWTFVDDWTSVLWLYALLLLAVFALFRILRVRLWVRLMVAVALAVPGLWYFGETAYLGGKFLNYNVSG